MCGIYLALSRSQHVRPSPKLLEALQHRGSDCVRLVNNVLRTDDHTDVYLSCVSTVLSLRGQQTVPQPVGCEPAEQDALRSPFLCWNGEAWAFAGKSISGNDSSHVFQLLSHVSRSTFASAPGSRELAMAQAFAMLSGPYAFAYCDHTNQRLYFGRDVLGRRSLLHRTTESGDFLLSSVSDADTSGWLEVEADGIYWVELSSRDDQGRYVIRSVPYANAIEIPKTPNDLHVPTDSTSPISSQSTSVATLERLLRRSLSLRVQDIPTMSTTQGTSTHTIKPARLAVLFSGGLDCTVLARLAHDILDVSEPIDLLNVAFENPRVHKQPTTNKDQEGYSPYELCPDRITGRTSFAELQRVCPQREWRFLAVDIPYMETVAHRTSVTTLMHPHNTEMDLSIACALYFAARGSGTISNGNGSIDDYTTAARVLLSGLGADELFAGYTRHGTAFTRRGYQGLLEELDLDVGRLGKRNLGRDDRVISAWAREARFPLLDEDLVRWALQTPVWQKCGFGERESDGQPLDESEALDPSKKVLRCLAWKLGIIKVANEKKRAIQFGARTAKMEAGRTKGTQIIS